MGTHLLICGIGVDAITPTVLSPNNTPLPTGALQVNTSLEVIGATDMYAAGDCCTVTCSADSNELKCWFQMKLWSQVFISI